MSDVIKTVHCGCGGEAYSHMLGNAITQGYYICCEECGTKTAVHGTLTEAVKAWNIAMSGNETGVRPPRIAEWLAQPLTK